MQLLESIEDQVNKISRDHVKCSTAPIKNLLRVFEKAVLDYKGLLSRVTDLVRGRLLCNDMRPCW